MPKWIRNLGLVLAIFALVYSISRIPRPTLRPETPPVPAEIVKIEVTGNTLRTPIVFVRAGERWNLSEPLAYRANDAQVVSLLAAARSLTLEAVLSRREAAWGLFGLDDAQGIRLSLWPPHSDKPLVWVIGKNAPDGLRVYARTTGKPETYLAKGISREGLEEEPDKWREASLLPLEPGDEIVSARVRRGKVAFAVSRASDSWTLDGYPADRAAVDKLINNLRAATVAAFVDPPASLNLRDFELLFPKGEIELGLASGRASLLRIGKSEKGESPRLILRRDEEPTLLWVPTEALDLYRSTPQDLKTK